MKLFGYELQRIANKIITPAEEKQGTFTISLSTTQRKARDMSDFIAALSTAESTVKPLRYRLYDIYGENLDYVPHLRALYELRHNKIKQREIKYLKKSGKEDEVMTEWLKAPEFKAFLSDLLDTQFYGFSLFDFTEYAGKEWFGYDLINRKHVDPIKKWVYRYQYGAGGESYDIEGRQKYIMAVGKERDFGLFKTAAPVCINIRNLTGDMMNYVELAGNNFTITKTKHNDPNIKNQLNQAIRNLGSTGNVNLPDGVADIQFESLSSSQQNQLFTSIHDLLIKELSKLMVGATMGVEDGSSYSQAQVHERTMGSVFASDETFILDQLNYYFADKLPLFGKNNNGRFVFEQSHTEEDMEELAKDKLLMSLGLNLTPEYLAEKYNIPTEAIKKNDTTEDQQPKPEAGNGME